MKWSVFKSGLGAFVSFSLSVLVVRQKFFKKGSYLSLFYSVILMLVTDTWDNVLELLPAIFIHSFLMFWLLAFTLIYIEYKKVIGMKRPPLTRLVVSHLTVFFVGYLAIGFAFGTFAIWCLPVFESLLSGVVNLVIVMGLIRVLIVFDKKQRSYKIE